MDFYQTLLRKFVGEETHTFYFKAPVCRVQELRRAIEEAVNDPDIPLDDFDREILLSSIQIQARNSVLH